MNVIKRDIEVVRLSRGCTAPDKINRCLHVASDEGAQVCRLLNDGTLAEKRQRRRLVGLCWMLYPVKALTHILSTAHQGRGKGR